MLKKTVTYLDWNDDEVTEDLYFHLSESDLVELETSVEGGFSETIRTLIDTEDGATIVKEFKKILLMSYGKKSADGKRFLKNDRIREEFESSKAFTAIFMELITDADAVANFVKGVVPSGLDSTVAEIAKANQTAEQVRASNPGVLGKEPQILTRLQLAELSAEEFAEVRPKLATGEVKIAD